MDTTKSSARVRAAHPAKLTEEKLAKLEERYRHEFMDVEERCELGERIVRLRRRLDEKRGVELKGV